MHAVSGPRRPGIGRFGRTSRTPGVHKCCRCGDSMGIADTDPR
nr:hypothetical protein [Kibdelosporangium sp. MJ126-NF4]